MKLDNVHACQTMHMPGDPFDSGRIPRPECALSFLVDCTFYADFANRCVPTEITLTRPPEGSQIVWHGTGDKHAGWLRTN
jgi:hypothetical protein